MLRGTADEEGFLRGYDDWKTDADNPEQGSKGGRVYVCRDCPWRGRGASAYQHHAMNHHRIAHRDGGMLLEFSCCLRRREANRER